MNGHSLISALAVESYHGVVGWPDQTLGECCSLQLSYQDAERAIANPWSVFYRTERAIRAAAYAESVPHPLRNHGDGEERCRLASGVGTWAL